MKFRFLAAFALIALALGTVRCGDDGLRILVEKDGGSLAPKPDAGSSAGAPDAASVEERPDAGIVKSPADAGESTIVDAGARDCTGEPVIEPYSSGGPFGGFQSDPGNGAQRSITVSFPCPVSSVTVTILDPDFPLNEMLAYDDQGSLLTSAKFQGDGTPGTYTEDTLTLAHSGIAKVVLSPDPGDYVAYKDLAYTR